MAQNDMYVVMYKIIAYLYDCMKKGAEPDISRWELPIARIIGCLEAIREPVEF